MWTCTRLPHCPISQILLQILRAHHQPQQDYTDAEDRDDLLQLQVYQANTSLIGYMWRMPGTPPFSLKEDGCDTGTRAIRCHLGIGETWYMNDLLLGWAGYVGLTDQWQCGHALLPLDIGDEEDVPSGQGYKCQWVTGRILTNEWEWWTFGPVWLSW